MDPKIPSPSGEICPSTLFLLETFHPVVGGGESHARLLAAEMHRRGASVTVLTRRRTTAMSRRDAVDGVPVVRVGPSGLPRLGKYLMLVTALPALIRLRREYDLIYVCGLRVLGVLGVVASRLLGKPCVLRAEAQGELSGDFARREVRRDSFLDRLVAVAVGLRNSLLLRADAFVSISQVITEEFEVQGVASERLRAIPNGIDTHRFRPASPPERRAARGRQGIPQDAYVFVYTGKLIRRKGLPALLRSFQHLREDHEAAHLLLVGSGGLQALSCEEELREFVDREEDLSDSVTFTGYVTDVESYLGAADAFVLPSESEAFPLSLLEAMSCGLVPIGSQTGGILEVIRHEENGFLVPVRDEEALLAALRRVLVDRESARRMGEQARQDVGSRYGIERIADEHCRFFAELLARPSID